MQLFLWAHLLLGRRNDIGCDPFPHWLSKVVGGRWRRSPHNLVPVVVPSIVPALCPHWSHTSAASSTGPLFRAGLKQGSVQGHASTPPPCCLKAFSYVQQTQRREPQNASACHHLLRSPFSPSYLPTTPNPSNALSTFFYITPTRAFSQQVFTKYLLATMNNYINEYPALLFSWRGVK